MRPIGRTGQIWFGGGGYLPFVTSPMGKAQVKRPWYYKT